ncbi:membrane hypothetical protein [Lactococcus piscium]|uniref:DUF1129 family protein n=1 Tax=Pseudolactococcus carnosus TaxID=2749961 RepID=UPI000BDAF1D1|nr:DUF1129 family protein [Lactococcus carnosus]MCJ2000000.1 DUF1129 family protein [Lactococcus carnosus]SOB48693.1 membrane hypothetical protein [Lactococcus piscium]
MITIGQQFKADKAEHTKNKALINQMTPENQAYDDTFVASLYAPDQLSGKDSQSLPDILETVRADILLAQKTQQAAETYFGMPAETLAKQFIDALPQKTLRQKIKRQGLISAYLAVIFAIIFLTPWFGGGLTPQNIGLFTLTLLLNLCLLYVPSWLLTLYPQKSSQGRTRLTTYLTAGISALFLIVILIVKQLL